MRSAVLRPRSKSHICLTLTLGMFAWLIQGPIQAGTLPGRDDTENQGGSEVGMVEVRFTDNSVLKLKLIDEAVILNTPYGKLRIPIAAIQRIEFGTRVAEDVNRRIEAAVANLGSPEFRQREAASAELLRYRAQAYPALQEATRQKDQEIVRRAEGLLERIRESVPSEQLEYRKHDIVVTEDSKISGRLEGLTIKARTAQFGDVGLKLHDLRNLRSLSAPDETVALTALPDPGTLAQFQNQLGKVLVFRVTGAQTGSLWGSDVYTADSQLAAVAVHSGVLRAGQAGVIRVKVVPPPQMFRGSIRNGISSGSYGAYTGAYQVLH